MATIAVDIDSSLYDFESPSREAMYKMYKETGDDTYMRGAYMPWTEWRTPTDTLGLEKWLGIIAMVHDSEIILKQQPFPGAVETCQALMDEGHKLLYISNRATESQDATKEWLRDCGFLGNDSSNQRDVLCTQEDKQQYMAECQYLIDDRPKTVVQFVYDFGWADSLIAGEVAGERKAFVKGYAYNQALTDVPNVYVAMDWYGINEYLVRKGVLNEAAVQPLEV
jgi:hypothetical protein